MKHKWLVSPQSFRPNIISPRALTRSDGNGNGIHSYESSIKRFREKLSIRFHGMTPRRPPHTFYPQTEKKRLSHYDAVFIGRRGLGLGRLRATRNNSKIYIYMLCRNGKAHHLDCRKLNPRQWTSSNHRWNTNANGAWPAICMMARRSPHSFLSHTHTHTLTSANGIPTDTVHRCTRSTLTTTCLSILVNCLQKRVSYLYGCVYCSTCCTAADGWEWGNEAQRWRGFMDENDKHGNIRNGPTECHPSGEWASHRNIERVNHEWLLQVTTQNGKHCHVMPRPYAYIHIVIVGRSGGAQYHLYIFREGSGSGRIKRGWKVWCGCADIRVYID